ncbi:hypothetical protein SCUP234_00949 [Seiridium cupressi]
MDVKFLFPALEIPDDEDEAPPSLQEVRLALPNRSEKVVSCRGNEGEPCSAGYLDLDASHEAEIQLGNASASMEPVRTSNAFMKGESHANSITNASVTTGATDKGGETHATTAPHEGFKCNTCLQVKPIDQFIGARSAYIIVMSCLACRTLDRKQLYHVRREALSQRKLNESEREKVCHKCRKLLPIDHLHAYNYSTSGRILKTCSKCRNRKQPDSAVQRAGPKKCHVCQALLKKEDFARAGELSMRDDVQICELCAEEQLKALVDEFQDPAQRTTHVAMVYDCASCKSEKAEEEFLRDVLLWQACNKCIHHPTRDGKSGVRRRYC